MKKGFTLVELLAVIVILAIILAIAVPAIGNLISNARKNTFENGAKLVLKSMKLDYDGKIASAGTYTDTFILYDNGVRTVYPSSNNLDFTISATDGGIVRHSDGTVTLALYDGYSCVTKTRTSNDILTTTTDKATCLSNIYYKQASAPFNNQLANGSFSSGTAGWTAAGASHFVSNNIMTNISSGSLNAGQEYNNTTLNFSTGNIVYASAIMKPPANSVLIRIQIEGGGPEVIKQQPPIIDAWQKISGRLTVAQTYTSPKLWLAHIYSTAAIASGKSCDFAEVIFINLTTTYGAGNEPLQNQMDHNLNKVWIDTANSNTPKRFTAGGWVNY